MCITDSLDRSDTAAVSVTMIANGEHFLRADSLSIVFRAFLLHLINYQFAKPGSTFRSFIKKKDGPNLSVARITESISNLDFLRVRH